jgi:hypothetical protein
MGRLGRGALVQVQNTLWCLRPGKTRTARPKRQVSESLPHVRRSRARWPPAADRPLLAEVPTLHRLIAKRELTYGARQRPGRVSGTPSSFSSSYGPPRSWMMAPCWSILCDPAPPPAYAPCSAGARWKPASAATASSGGQEPSTQCRRLHRSGRSPGRCSIGARPPARAPAGGAWRQLVGSLHGRARHRRDRTLITRPGVILATVAVVGLTEGA